MTAPTVYPHPYTATDPEANLSCFTCGMGPEEPDANHVTEEQAAAPPPPEVPAELQAARISMEVQRMQSAEAAYDVEAPVTLRERLAYAKSLAASGLVPKAFRSSKPGEDGRRETAANILLAVDLGSTLGLSPLQALCQINVVEGKPGLGAEGQRAQVLRHGHDIWVDEDLSDHEQAVMHGKRSDSDRVVTMVYTLDDAVRAGLVRIVEGKPWARSQTGKPLPWELSTADMLVARCTTRMCKRVFPDVVGGLTSEEDLGDQWRPSGGVVTASGLMAGPLPPAADTLDEDLALFSEDNPWWEHAGATVRRRNKLQLAADRIAARNDDPRVPKPDGGDSPEPDAQDDIVDAELVPDVPEVPEPVVVDVGEAAVEVNRALAADPEAFDPFAPGAPVTEPLPGGGFEDPPLGAAGALPDALPEPEETAPGADQEPETAPGADAGDRDTLWAEVEELAANKGKTVAQLMSRWTLANRVNPEDATADQLLAFLKPHRELGQ